MGRHGGHETRFRPLPVVLGALALAAVVVLGLWWWNLRAGGDPIDADPQRAYAQVISSTPCIDPEPGTTVELVVGGAPVQAVLNGCGYKAGQRLAVEYATGAPEVVRLAGTSATPASPLGKRLLPLLILLIGTVAAGAAWALIREKKRRRSRRAREGAVSVEEMRQRIAAARAATEGRPAAVWVGQTPDSPAPTAAPEDSAAGSADDLETTRTTRPGTDLFGGGPGTAS